jgi:thiamine biosynthesis lipoprotein ApbE
VPVAQEAPPAARSTIAPVTAPPFEPAKLELHETAMGTRVTFVTFTTRRVDETAARLAMAKALAEIVRLEAILSEWRNDSEVGQINGKPGEWVKVGPESLEVIEKGLWAGSVSQGVVDITFQAMSDVWRFGSPCSSCWR